MGAEAPPRLVAGSSCPEPAARVRAPGSPPPAPGLVYRFARRVVGLVLAVFFDRVECSGVEKVPGDCPILFAANHPNEMLDPFMIGRFHSGKVYFLAKSTLFAFAPFGWLLRQLGGIPIYRQRDAGSEMSRNQDSFRECYSALERGEAIGIFPEGTSHSGPSLLPLKTGAARIVLGAEAANGFELGTAVVPVGLHFLDRDEFRSDAVALFGEPIRTAAYREAYQADPQAAARELTVTLEAALRALTLNLREKDEELFLEQLRKIFKHELPGYLPGPDAADQVALTRGLADAYYRLCESAPDRVHRLRRRIAAYLRFLRIARIRPGAADFTPVSALAYLCWTVPLGLLLLPIAAHGLFHNWLPYRIPGWYVRSADLDEVEHATFKIAAGLITFPLFYALQTAAVFALFGAPLATVYLLSLPVTGLFAYGYCEAARVFWIGLRSFLLFVGNLDFAARLNTMRAELRTELAALADWYLAETGIRLPNAR